MSEHRGWGLPESHLLPDAVVAFVDQELSLGAHERAASHVAHCPSCAAEVTAQRQARTAVQRAAAPSMSPGFLASLCSIPQETELSETPDNLAVTEDGQLVAIQRPDRVAGLRNNLEGSESSEGSRPLGGSAPLGNSPHALGNGARLGVTKRRAAQGAGVVVSGLVLSALALVATSGAGGAAGGDRTGDAPSPGVLRAQFKPTSKAPSSPASTSAAATTKPRTSAEAPQSPGPSGASRTTATTTLRVVAERPR